MASENKRGNKMKREENISLHFGRIRAVERKSNSRERNSNFSRDFSVFEQSVLVGPRSKVVLRSKGYTWALVLWSFDNSKR